MAALTVAEHAVRTELVRTVEEWGRALANAQTSEELNMVISLIAQASRDIRMAPLASVAGAIERASERLQRIAGKR